MQSSKLYPFTKFVALGQPQDTVTGRRNYILWIIIIIFVLVLSCSSSLTYYVKKYANAAGVGDDLVFNKTPPSRDGYSVGVPKLWMYTNYKATSEDLCQESRQLQAIPANVIAQLNNDDVHNRVNVALLLHVEGLIKNRDPENLKDIFNDYNRKLISVAKFEDFVDFMRNLNSNQVRFCLNFLKPGAELANFGSYFALVDELRTWYNYLHLLGGFLSAYEQQKRREFFVNVTEVNFYKFTTETQEKLYHFVYSFSLTRGKVLEINGVVQRWMKPLNVEVRNGSHVFSNAVVLISEVNKKVGNASTVHVLCGHTLYLDEDVTLPGVNLGIVAPRWVFLKRVKISLNGVDGPEHEDHPKGSGKPGNPGGNAGDFLGVGHWDEDYLVVSANGGKGGKGQNGAKGRDGVDYTRPDPPPNKPRCLSRIDAFQNSHNQTITRYKIFGEHGCGGSGSDGGVGGVGGKGGVIILINKSVKIIKGSSGEPGSPGKGGAGGAGGRDGCFYEVFDVDDEVLHRVTNIKCTRGNSLPSGKTGKDGRNKKGLVQPRVKSNLSACDCIVNFIRSVDLDANKNPPLISTLRMLNRYDAGSECALKKYNAYKKYDSIELYNIFKEETNSRDKYLNSLLLARILILKNNINYFFTDYVNYLNVIEKSVKCTNERTRELQPIAFLKRKVAAKAEKLTQNLKVIKSKLINLNELGEFGAEKTMTCVMLTTMDAMFSLSSRPDVEIIRKLDSFIKECLAPDEYIVDGDTDVILPQNKKFEKLLIGIEDVGRYLKKLREALAYLNDSLVLVPEKKKLLGELLSELEHLAALCGFMEWEESAWSFFRSLEASTNATDRNGVSELLKSELLDCLLLLQYTLAEDAARQRRYPIVQQDARPRLAGNTTLMEEVIDRIKLLRQSPTPNINCKNELEAYFGKNSAVGEFYYWSNADVRGELEAIFSGAEVRLESSLINRHALDKNFIRFRSVKLEFESGNARHGKLLRDILLDYKVAITHSGYSHYNWMGESHLVVSEEMTFDHSFKTRENGEPELYSVLYKKVENGSIKLSPYTTWTVRLLPINERADYRDLKPYKDRVSLKLTGIGTFLP